MGLSQAPVSFLPEFQIVVQNVCAFAHRHNQTRWRYPEPVGLVTCVTDGVGGLASYM